jgi:hypothetical protein
MVKTRRVKPFARLHRGLAQAPLNVERGNSLWNGSAYFSEFGQAAEVLQSRAFRTIQNS